MGDVGEVAKVAGKAIDVGEKLVEALADENERDRIDDWQHRWDAAIARADATALDRLLAERRRAGDDRLPAAGSDRTEAAG